MSSVVSSTPACRSNARWAATLLRQLEGFAIAAQGFPVCERGVLPSVRFGGMLLLEGFELPDQAVLEGLNALLELDRSFRTAHDGAAPVAVHEGFLFVASAHDGASPVGAGVGGAKVCSSGNGSGSGSSSSGSGNGSGDAGGNGSRRRAAARLPSGLSPALVSRLTCILVDPPLIEQMAAAYGGLLRRRLGNGEHAAAGVEFLFGSLHALLKVHPLLAPRVTLRRLLQWCDYVHLDRDLGVKGSRDETLANLALGGHVLFIDQLSSPTQREAAIRAVGVVEAAHSRERVGMNVGTVDASLSVLVTEQHAEPDAAHGHAGQLTWLRTLADGSRALNFLGFRLPRGADEGFGGFEPSLSAVRNLARVLVARDTGHAINLVGPPGIGKTAVVEATARLLGRPFTRISCSRSLSVDDLFGAYRPSLDVPSGEVVFTFERGALAAAIEAQGIVLLDELNLAPADVLGVLAGLLSCAPDEPFSMRAHRLRRGQTIFVGAMNDVRVGGGRHELPVRLDDLLTPVHLAPLDATEVACIAHGACGAAFARAQGEAADVAAHRPWLLDLALELNASLPVDVPGLDTPFNLRTIQHLAAVFESVSWEHLDGGGGVIEDQRAQGRGQVSLAPSSGP